MLSPAPLCDPCGKDFLTTEDTGVHGESSTQQVWLEMSVPTSAVENRAPKIPRKILRDDDPAAACLFRPGDDRLLFRKLRKEEIDERPRLRPSGCASQAHAHEEYQRLQHVGIAQPRVADLLLLGLAKL